MQQSRTLEIAQYDCTKDADWMTLEYTAFNILAPAAVIDGCFHLIHIWRTSCCHTCYFQKSFLQRIILTQIEEMSLINASIRLTDSGVSGIKIGAPRSKNCGQACFLISLFMFVTLSIIQKIVMLQWEFLLRIQVVCPVVNEI